jgi:hypothetical protein
MNEWVTIVGQLGVGGTFGLIMFLVYRSDKKETQAMLAKLVEASDSKFSKLCSETEGRMAQVLHETVQAMKENTAVTGEIKGVLHDEAQGRAEMITLLRVINGRLTSK